MVNKKNEEAHVPKVVGSNPGTVHWMDMTFFTLICCKNCNDICLKRPKINKKEAGSAHFIKKTWSPVFVNLNPNLDRVEN